MKNICRKVESAEADRLELRACYSPEIVRRCLCTIPRLKNSYQSSSLYRAFGICRERRYSPTTRFYSPVAPGTRQVHSGRILLSLALKIDPRCGSRHCGLDCATSLINAVIGQVNPPFASIPATEAPCSGTANRWNVVRALSAEIELQPPASDNEACFRISFLNCAVEARTASNLSLIVPCSRILANSFGGSLSSLSTRLSWVCALL